MKFPQNLILDYSISRSAYSVKHWIHNFENSINLIYKFKNLSLSQHLLLKNNFYSFFFAANFKILTLKKQHSSTVLKKINKNKTLFKKSSLNKFKSNLKSKQANKKKNLNLAIKTIFNKSKYAKKYKINAILSSVLKPSFFGFGLNEQGSFFKSLFDLNFLRKEKIYTKLKYSRVPQYDTVSGAAAALLAGFLGFLICEKFGFELLDSGDFYFLFMYLVFLFFSSRLFIKLFSFRSNNWNVLSFKWFIYYCFSVSKFFKIFKF